MLRLWRLGDGCRPESAGEPFRGGFQQRERSDRYVRRDQDAFGERRSFDSRPGEETCFY